LSTTATSQSRLEAVRTPAAGGGLVVGLPLALLCAGHFTVDLYSSAVSTLQPVLVERYALTLAQSGWLGGVFLFGSAVMQLGFGLVSDRFRSKLFAVVGILAAGGFLTSLGLAPGYGTLLALAFLGGLGVAAFHPQSTSHAGLLGGRRRGFAVALFITVGTLGLATGPAYFSWWVQTAGLERLWLAAVPAVVMAAALLAALPSPPPPVRAPAGSADAAALRDHWKPLLAHYLIVVLRSAVQLGFAQFLSLYLYNERGFSLTQASWGLAAFFGSIAAGSFFGGSWADRIGGKKVVVLSLLLSVPFFLLFLQLRGWLSILCLFVGGLFLLMSNPVIVVMAQELLPSRAATVTAMMMGFGWGMAGITFVPLFGWVADHTGLEAIFRAMAFVPLLTALLALRLPAHPAQTPSPPPT